jgi:NADPH:quinone reductase-like Zn-dependent oxidoreductase
MAAPAPQPTYKVWQYTSTHGGIEKNIKLVPSVRTPTPKPNQHLVQVLAVSINPVDYKLAELPFIGRLLRPKTATPGFDIAGRLIVPASGSSLNQDNWSSARQAIH